MDDVVFATRLNGSANGCQYLKAICPDGDDDHWDGFFLDLSFMGEFDHECYIEASYCGGIFCFNAFNGRIALCNPFANTVKFLPPPLLAPPSSYISFYNCGFGYDFTSDDYKVIRIFDVVKYNMEDHYSFSGATRKCELFSFKRNSWKEIESEGSSFLCADGGYALVDCSYHWLAVNSILAFNFSEEIFSYISLPPSFNVRSFNGDTPVCHVVVTPNYRLGVIFYSRVGESKTFQVWEYGIDEVWSKLYNDDAIISNVDKPLNLNGSLMYVSRETSPGYRQLLVYDWVGRTLKELDIHDCEEVLGISTITTSFPTPNLLETMPIKYV
ncbi:F-box protein CPR1-like [Salvia miltiorrhiza]|uniref:F-box protein CPR1-like n=1 Tax=Salvia miltiorrhiza TaxID=226208 RepID=UPI0025AD74D9|nr:F-box protein CPR1-like [Salvia miltiorrhiza]